jgi:hypothetical protein
LSGWQTVETNASRSYLLTIAHQTDDVSENGGGGRDLQAIVRGKGLADD